MAGLVIATEWNEFRQPTFSRMKKLMKQPMIFEGRNLLDPETAAEHGFTYYSVGQKIAFGPASEIGGKVPPGSCRPYLLLIIYNKQKARNKGLAGKPKFLTQAHRFPALMTIMPFMIKCKGELT